MEACFSEAYERVKKCYWRGMEFAADTTHSTSKSLDVERSTDLSSKHSLCCRFDIHNRFDFEASNTPSKVN